MYTNRIKYFLSCCLLTLSIGQVDYNSEIQTILNDNCTNCHGNSGGLNLTSFSNLIEGSNNGAVITPYNHATSELYNRITLPSSSNFDMPPGNNDLTDDQVNLIAQWIDEGALPEAPDCDSTIACGQAETCCDGLLYPTTCCETNCDEPIGECGDETLQGDLNDDGILNVLDIVLMVNMVLDDGYDGVADMNGDGVINVLDIVTLINTILI